MATLTIIINATEDACDITVNGLKRTYESVRGGCRGIEKGDWEDDISNGLISEAFADVVDRLAFFPLDAMQACFEADFD